MVFLRISVLWCAKVSSAAVVICTQGYDPFLTTQTEITLKGHELTSRDINYYESVLSSNWPQDIIAYSYLLVQ
jgi:hypothetical protein